MKDRNVFFEKLVVLQAQKTRFVSAVNFETRYKTPVL
jgi:hypothetical protein